LLLSGTVALVAPFVGQAVDQWGAFRVISFAVIGEVLGFFLLGTVPADFAWYASAVVLLALLALAPLRRAFPALLPRTSIGAGPGAGSDDQRLRSDRHHCADRSKTQHQQGQEQITAPQPKSSRSPGSATSAQ